VPTHKAFFEAWELSVKEEDTVVLFSPLIDTRKESDPMFWFNWISLLPGKTVYIRSPIEWRISAKDLYDTFDVVVPTHKFYAENVELSTDCGILPGTVMFSYLPTFIPKKAIDRFFSPKGHLRGFRADDLKRSHYFFKKVFNNPKNGFTFHFHGVAALPRMNNKQSPVRNHGIPVTLSQELAYLVDKEGTNENK
jgi:hypothetical protein